MGKLYSWMRLAVFIFLVNHSYAKIYDAALLQNIDEMGGLVMIEYALSMYSINTALSEFKNGNANADVSLLNTPPNDRNSSEYNDEKYKPDTAAEAWEFGGSAWPYEDWIRNAANIENSGAQKFFSDWIADYSTDDSHDCKSRKQSPMGCLAYVYWGDTKFRCPIDKTEACRAPSFLEIQHNIKTHWSKSLTLEEQIALARKVMFTAENFQTLLWNTVSLHDIIEVAKNEIGRAIPRIVNEFAAERDGKKIAHCELVKVMIELGFDIVMEAGTLGMSIGGFPGVMPQKISDKAQRAKKWTEFSMSKAMEITGTIRSWEGKGRAVDAAIKKAIAKAGDTSLSSAYGSMPALEIHMSKATGLCGNAFSVPEDDSGSQIEASMNFMVDYMDETMGSLERQWRSLIIFQEDGSVSPLLDALMSLQYIRPSDVSDNVYSESKSAFITAFDNLLISKILAGNRCFMACENRMGASQICGTGNDELDKSRFCPEDIINHQNNYGLSLAQLANNSWDFYKDSGSLGPLLTNAIVDENLQTKQPNYKLVHLPVCLSNVPTIDPKKLKTASFPYTCGSYKCEQSGLFVEAVNVHFDQETELLRNRFGSVKWHLRKVTEPLNLFMALCALDIRWPYKASHKHYNAVTEKWETDRTHNLRANSRDDRCDHVDQATQGMTEHEANKAFCEMDLVAAIIKDEKKLGLAAPVVKNTKERCKKWMRGHGYAFDLKNLNESQEWNQTRWEEEHGTIEEKAGKLERGGDQDESNGVEDGEAFQLEERDVLVDEDFDDDGKMPDWAYALGEVLDDEEED